jgi:hypothetical protein
VVIKLQRHTHHIIALIGQICSNYRAVDATRHGHDHPCFGRGFGKAKRIQRGIGLLRHQALLEIRGIDAAEYRKILTILKG